MSRILPFLFLACALGAEGVQPGPPVKAVRLKLDISPSSPSVALDPKEVTADLEGFLVGQGIPVAPEGKEAPEGAFELEVPPITLRYVDLRTRKGSRKASLGKVQAANALQAGEIGIPSVFVRQIPRPSLLLEGQEHLGTG